MPVHRGIDEALRRSMTGSGGDAGGLGEGPLHCVYRNGMRRILLSAILTFDAQKLLYKPAQGTDH